MVQKRVVGLAVMAALASGCASVSSITRTDGAKVGAPVPKYENAAQVPKSLASEHFMLSKFRGLGPEENIGPSIPVSYVNYTIWFDEVCLQDMQRIGGVGAEVASDGAGYMFGDGAGLAAGVHLAAVPMTAAKAFWYGAGPGLGVGIVGGAIYADAGLAYTHGYCVSRQVDMAQRIRRVMQDIAVIPLGFRKATAQLQPVEDHPSMVKVNPAAFDSIEAAPLPPPPPPR